MGKRRAAACEREFEAVKLDTMDEDEGTSDDGESGDDTGDEEEDEMEAGVGYA